MNVIKDYFGHEIHKGDVVLYNEKASKGYRSSFTEGVVIGFNTPNTVSVTGYEYLEEFKTGGYNYLMYRKSPNDVVNLTALGIREKVELF